MISTGLIRYNDDHFYDKVQLSMIISRSGTNMFDQLIISKIRCDNLYEQSIFENEDWSLSL